MSGIRTIKIEIKVDGDYCSHDCTFLDTDEEFCMLFEDNVPGDEGDFRRSLKCSCGAIDLVGE